MPELKIISQESKNDNKVFPRLFMIGVILLSTAVFIGIPGVMLERYSVIVGGGFYPFFVALASLIVFAVDYFSPNRKYIISGTCIIINFLVICLIVFCSIYSFLGNQQRILDKMKYHMMKSAYSIEQEKQLTGQLPDMNEIYYKYFDEFKPGDGIFIEYVTFGGKKGYEIRGETAFVLGWVFNSEFSHLGVVHFNEITKDGKIWLPDYDYNREN